MRSLLPVLISGLLLGGAASAKHWHDDDKHSKKHAKNIDDDPYFDHRAGNCQFHPTDVRVVREYYAPQYRNLPPGIQKKLYKTGRLPPGWQKKMQPLPVVVERRMAPIPVDYRRGVIDGSVVIYNPRTQIVIDVFAVFGGR